MPNCEAAVRCNYRIEAVRRFNILVKASKYSRNFPVDTSDDEAKKYAEEACKSGTLHIEWDNDWMEECIELKLGVYRRLVNRIEGLDDSSNKALELHNLRKEALHDVFEWNVILKAWGKKILT